MGFLIAFCVVWAVCGALAWKNAGEHEDFITAAVLVTIMIGLAYLVTYG